MASISGWAWGAAGLSAWLMVYLGGQGFRELDAMGAMCGWRPPCVGWPGLGCHCSPWQVLSCCSCPPLHTSIPAPAATSPTHPTLQGK